MRVCVLSDTRRRARTQFYLAKDVITIKICDLRVSTTKPPPPDGGDTSDWTHVRLAGWLRGLHDAHVHTYRTPCRHTHVNTEIVIVNVSLGGCGRVVGRCVPLSIYQELYIYT